LKAKQIIGTADQQRIKNTVAEAELLTSGEIRIFVEDHSEDDALDRAVFLFEELGMQKTELRNGILIYVAIKDKHFSIIGDAGIHAKVGDPFWEGIRNEMRDHFSHGHLADGIVAGVIQAGKALKEFFPRQHDDVNELPDDIIFGKGDQ
jgi:uncharacterized membrane protein